MATPVEENKAVDELSSTFPTPDAANKDLRRVAFVTVGATAGFQPLLQEVLSGPFIDKLIQLGYTQLVIQCGPDSEFVEACFPSEEDEEQQQQQQEKKSGDDHDDKKELRERRNSFIRRIAVFAYTSEMTKWMRLAGPGIDEDGGRRDYGVIISHAGSGTILDALRVNARLIAVANPALMNNHQEELAKEMDRQGFLVWGKLGSLANSVQYIEEHVPNKWPPEAPADQPFPGGLWDVIEMFQRQH